MGLDLGIEIEEGVDAVAKLGLDLLAAAFEDVHGYLGLVAILEDDRSGLDRFNLIRGEKPHTVYKY